MLERLDKVLVDQGLAQSRTQAQKLIEAGVVRASIHGQWVFLNKPAHKIAADTQLQVGEIEELRFVSRAGLKLDLALTHLHDSGAFSDLHDFLRHAFVLDIGQSTGGFTDCLLQRGVQQVVGVDVGSDQLAGALRENPSVICLENINARNLPADMLRSYSPAGFDLAVMDVSFISQSLILPNIPTLLKSGGYLLSLVKPQFEVGAKNLAKGGIVKNSQLYDEVKTKMTRCALESGMIDLAYFESGIEGGDGNREFFMLCRKS